MVAQIVRLETRFCEMQKAKMTAALKAELEEKQERIHDAVLVALGEFGLRQAQQEDAR